MQISRLLCKCGVFIESSAEDPRVGVYVLWDLLHVDVLPLRPHQAQPMSFLSPQGMLRP